MAVRAPSTERTCLALALVGLLVGLIPTPASSQEETVPPPDAESDAPDVRTTLPQVDAPVAGEPQRFLRAASGDGVLLQRAGDVLDVESGSVVASAMEKDEAFVVRDSACEVGAEGVSACAHVAIQQHSETVEYSETGADGKSYKVQKTIFWKDTKVAYSTATGHYQQLAIGQDSRPSPRDEAVGTRYQMSVLGFHLDKANRPFLVFAVTRTDTRRGDKDRLESKVDQKVQLWRGDGLEDFAPSKGPAVVRGGGTAPGQQARDNPMLQIVDHGDKTCYAYTIEPRVGGITFECPGSPGVEVVEQAMYDYRLVSAADGWLYLFYHAPSDEAAMVASSADGVTWQALPLDNKESGWQLDAAVQGSRAYVLYYYFRNSYNKGLRLAAMEGGKLIQSPMTLVRRADHNTGWHPFLGVSSSGHLWLTWWDDVLEQTRVWARLPTPDAIFQHVVNDTGGWEDIYKNWYLQGGAGAWYTRWSPFGIVPRTEDLDGVRLGDQSYTLADALLTSTSLEAEFFGWNLGLTYARSILQDAGDALGDRLGDDTVDYLGAQLKIDKVFPGHDVKVQFTRGRYLGEAEAGDNVIDGRDPLPIDTYYLDAKALFLNKWRVKYGITLSNYTLPMVLHTWHAPENETSYTYSGSFFRQTGVTEIKALIGYSTLDYVSKYENHYSGLVFDSTLDVGVGLLDFEAIQPATSAGAGLLTSLGEAQTTGFTLAGRLAVDLGYLFFHRWYSALGLGLYIQPVYAAEANLLGIPGKPGDREAPSGDSAQSTLPADTSVAVGVYSIRHGPRLDLGVVW